MKWNIFPSVTVEQHRIILQLRSEHMFGLHNMLRCLPGDVVEELYTQGMIRMEFHDDDPLDPAEYVLTDIAIHGWYHVMQDDTK